MLSGQLKILCGDTWVTCRPPRVFKAMHATEVKSIAVQELHIGQVINDVLYFFIWIRHLRNALAKSELNSLPAKPESGWTLEVLGNHSHVFGVLGLVHWRKSGK